MPELEDKDGNKVDASIDPKLLPPEDREVYEQQLNLKKGHTPEEKALFYGNISQAQHDPRNSLGASDEEGAVSYTHLTLPTNREV